METIKGFIVSIHRMSVPKLSSEALKKITDMMCPSAAAIKVWFFGWEKVRVTDLSSLTAQELNNIPT